MQRVCVVVVRSKVKYRAIKKEGGYLACCSIDLQSATDKFNICGSEHHAL